MNKTVKIFLIILLILLPVFAQAAVVRQVIPPELSFRGVNVFCANDLSRAEFSFKKAADLIIIPKGGAVFFTREEIMETARLLPRLPLYSLDISGLTIVEPQAPYTMIRRNKNSYEAEVPARVIKIAADDAAGLSQALNNMVIQQNRLDQFADFLFLLQRPGLSKNQQRAGAEVLRQLEQSRCYKTVSDTMPSSGLPLVQRKGKDNFQIPRVTPLAAVEMPGAFKAAADRLKSQATYIGRQIRALEAVKS
ncbi:MAG: hypothetical protein AB7G80_02595 [Dongiaceae bacterium]